ncbi:MAG: hypothetical protein GX334_03755, partial [Firmicutes bacterium]|nr:hypothetical protein [Bacillota bacterium]
KGNWKGRAGGRYLFEGGNKVFEKHKGPDVIFTLRKPSENWQEWAKTLGRQVLIGTQQGCIERGGVVYPYSIKYHNNSTVVKVDGLAKADRYILSAFRAVALKTAYCCHCQACQVECPVGALNINGMLKVGAACTAFGACLDLKGAPCLAAKSLMTTERGSNMPSKQSKSLPSYQTFGLRKTWLLDFFRLQGEWISNNNLGSRQLDSMIMWLRHAELTTGGRKSFTTTKLCNQLGKYVDNTPLIWSVIWTNLAQNSALVEWYVNNVPWGTTMPKTGFIELLEKKYKLSQRSRTNAITALFQLLAETPLGNELGLGFELTPGKRNTKLHKIGWQNPDPLSILYSLYRYAEKTDRYELTTRELYEGAVGGPYVLFGIERGVLKKVLQGLSIHCSNFIRAETVRDLDNIFLNNMCRAYEVLNLV